MVSKCTRIPQDAACFFVSDDTSEHGEECERGVGITTKQSLAYHADARLCNIRRAVYLPFEPGSPALLGGIEKHGCI